MVRDKIDQSLSYPGIHYKTMYRKDLELSGRPVTTIEENQVETASFDQSLHSYHLSRHCVCIILW